MNTNTQSNKASGGFDLEVSGDKLLNGVVEIDISAKLKELLGKELDCKIKLSFNEFRSSGSCSISFAGKAKGFKKSKSAVVTKVPGGPSTN